MQGDIAMPLLLGGQLVIAIHLPHEVGAQGLTALKALHLLHPYLQVPHHLILREGIMVIHLHGQDIIRLDLLNISVQSNAI